MMDASGRWPRAGRRCVWSLAWWPPLWTDGEAAELTMPRRSRRSHPTRRGINPIDASGTPAGPARRRLNPVARLGDRGSAPMRPRGRG